jgi:hypothetical protein
MKLTALLGSSPRNTAHTPGSALNHKTHHAVDVHRISCPTSANKCSRCLFTRRIVDKGLISSDQQERSKASGIPSPSFLCLGGGSRKCTCLLARLLRQLPPADAAAPSAAGLGRAGSAAAPRLPCAPAAAGTSPSDAEGASRCGRVPPPPASPDSSATRRTSTSAAGAVAATAQTAGLRPAEPRSQRVTGPSLRARQPQPSELAVVGKGVRQPPRR